MLKISFRSQESCKLHTRSNLRMQIYIKPTRFYTGKIKKSFFFRGKLIKISEPLGENFTMQKKKRAPICAGSAQ